MNKTRLIILLTTLLLGAILLAGCYVYLEYDPPDPSYVPVQGISGVPTGGVKNFDLLLRGAVSPANATNQNITWSVANDGGTGATIDLDVLTNLTASGTITVNATVAGGGKTRAEDYTQSFTIIIADEHHGVTNIVEVPTAGTTGVSLTLSGAVRPVNATNQTITWTIKSAGTTGAVIDGGVLKTTNPGTVTVTATVHGGGKQPSEDFTKDFEITVTGTFVPVTEIVNGPTTFLVGTHELTGTVEPFDATRKDIVWSIANDRNIGAKIDGDGKLEVYNPGHIVLRARIANGRGANGDYTQDFPIEIINVANTVSVTNIINVPSTIEVREPLALTGMVQPSNASFKQIEWTVVNAGKTGAVITDGTLNTTKRGTVIVQATIENGKGTEGNYTQDFTITVKGLIVYMVGYYADNSGDIPCYWEDDELFDLEFPVGSTYSKAVGIVEESGKVYIAGSYQNGSINKVCYWVIDNGTITRNEVADGSASAIAVSGNDVYVVGRDTDNNLCYRKNGTKVELVTNDLVDPQATAIAVNGTSVYVAGSYYDENYHTRACYWDTAGNYHPLPDNTAEAAWTKDLVVMNNKVYIVGGCETTSQIIPYVPLYWIDGLCTTLSSNGSSEAGVTAVTAEGNNWYAAGSYWNRDDYASCYWENGVFKTLSNGNEVSAITVLNGTIYVAGYVSHAKPCYWVNGVQEILPLGDATNGSVVGIAVVGD